VTKEETPVLRTVIVGHLQINTIGLTPTEIEFPFYDYELQSSWYLELEQGFLIRVATVHSQLVRQTDALG